MAGQKWQDSEGPSWSEEGCADDLEIVLWPRSCSTQKSRHRCQPPSVPPAPSLSITSAYKMAAPGFCSSPSLWLHLPPPHCSLAQAPPLLPLHSGFQRALSETYTRRSRQSQASSPSVCCAFLRKKIPALSLLTPNENWE